MTRVPSARLLTFCWVNWIIMGVEPLRGHPGSSHMQSLTHYKGNNPNESEEVPRYIWYSKAYPLPKQQGQNRSNVKGNTIVSCIKSLTYCQIHRMEIGVKGVERDAVASGIDHSQTMKSMRFSSYKWSKITHRLLGWHAQKGMKWWDKASIWYDITHILSKPLMSEWK